MDTPESPAKADPPDEAVAIVAQLLQQRAVFPLYQPIVDLDTGEIVGVEALARGPAGSPVESPEALFAAAAKAELMPLVDQLCFTRAVEIALRASHLMPPLLFVNAEPFVANEPIGVELLAAVRHERPFRIVMEYTERALPTHPQALLNLAGLARHDGNAVALDDVGADPVSLAFLPLLEPEVVKLDVGLLHDPLSNGTVETAAIVNAYAHSSRAAVIAEGIETDEDVATARALGAHWGQGWLFGRPGPLEAVAGRTVSARPDLRPLNQPDALPEDGDPFATVGQSEHEHACDGAIAHRLLDDVLATAKRGGKLAIIVGRYQDESLGRAWLNSLADCAETAAFVGLIGPALGGEDTHKVRLAVPQDPDPQEHTDLTVVAPYDMIAVRLKSGPGESRECMVTHDPHLVRVLARRLMRRFHTNG